MNEEPEEDGVEEQDWLPQHPQTDQGPAYQRQPSSIECEACQ